MTDLSESGTARARAYKGALALSIELYDRMLAIETDPNRLFLYKEVRLVLAHTLADMNTLLTDEVTS